MNNCASLSMANSQLSNRFAVHAQLNWADWL